MKIYDAVNKTEVEVDGTKGLIQIMKDGRQVDIYLKEKKSDEDGYMSWMWSTGQAWTGRDLSGVILWREEFLGSLQDTISMILKMNLSRKMRRWSRRWS